MTITPGYLPDRPFDEAEARAHRYRNQAQRAKFGPILASPAGSYVPLGRARQASERTYGASRVGGG